MHEGIQVTVDRDSVCAGDDTEPHLESFTVSASITISDFLDLINESHFLASIQGDKATWLIDCHAQGEVRCIGVAAQQWPRPKLIVPPDSLLVSLFDGSEPMLNFRYGAQADPDSVFACVESGQPLPDR